jgi:Gamma-glutamyl cyclotransferase, AIG2-like
MDNRRDLPGYKYYTGSGGDRPAVYVAFLDVRETDAPDRRTNGLCLPVEEHQLAELDQRERNYARQDVSDRIDAGGARVWTYVGTPDGRERLARGRRTGAAVIDAGYLQTVEAAFGALGQSEQEAAQASFDPGEIPVIELMRHELA